MRRLRCASPARVKSPSRKGSASPTEVEFVEEAGTVVVRKAEGGNRQAREWVRRYRGTADAGMTTDEIMRLTRGED